MSFRYKSGLLSLVSLVLVYGWYFASIGMDRLSGVHAYEPPRFTGAMALITLIQIVGNSLIAIFSKDRYGAMDERERAFDRRATGAGYYLLIVGALVAAALIHVHARAVDISDAVVLAVIVAESTRQATFLVLHHRTA